MKYMYPAGDHDAIRRAAYRILHLDDRGLMDKVLVHERDREYAWLLWLNKGGKDKADAALAIERRLDTLPPEGRKVEIIRNGRKPRIKNRKNRKVRGKKY